MGINVANYYYPNLAKCVKILTDVTWLFSVNCEVLCYMQIILQGLMLWSLVLLSIRNQFIRTERSVSDGWRGQRVVWSMGFFLDITAVGCPKYLLRLKALGVGAMWQQKTEKWGEMMPEITLKQFAISFGNTPDCVWHSYWGYSSSYYLLVCCIWLY